MAHFELEPLSSSFSLPLEFPVVGTGYDRRAGAIRKHCKRGIPLRLEREPDNPHDSNAIAVVLSRPSAHGVNIIDEHIGYVPADLAAELSDLLHRKAIAITSIKVHKVFAPDDVDSPRVIARIEGDWADGVQQLGLL